MRISDWSSDVCSSDLVAGLLGDQAGRSHAWLSVGLQVIESPGRATGVVVAKIGSADAPAAERLVGGPRGSHRLFVDCRRHFDRQQVAGGDLRVARVLGVVGVEPFPARPNLADTQTLLVQ